VGVTVEGNVTVREGVAAISRVDIGLGVGLTAALQAGRSTAIRRRVNNLFIKTNLSGVPRVKGRF
jgi:hypothetical protein